MLQAMQSPRFRPTGFRFFKKGGKDYIAKKVKAVIREYEAWKKEQRGVNSKLSHVCDAVNIIIFFPILRKTRSAALVV